MLEYAIIPISFEDYNELVDGLDDYGREGWIFSILIETYENSPRKFATTYNFLCYRKKRWWRKK